MLFKDAAMTLSVSTLAAVALPLVLVLALAVCLSCLKRKASGGFSNFSNDVGSTRPSNAHVNNSFSLGIEDTNVDNRESIGIMLESLPDISPKSKVPPCPLRPRVGSIDKAKSEASVRLIVSQGGLTVAVAHQAFPRGQIVYLKELGSGWFGKVIESDAEKITVGVPRTKVMVKMLKDDASKEEQQLFFEEVAPFRELEHTNIMRLLGHCTEMNPMLMILEYAAFGNLKQFLRSHRHEQATLIQKNRLIQFALDASNGLACLHAHDYLHRDLAARNCLVMSDHTLKIGDYGIAEDLFKEDYLSSGNDLLPIRWMAPETLKQENSTWTTTTFSRESDIWSLGVLLWEITMLGERPYDMLTDEAVLQGVITDKDIHLPEPDIGMPCKDRLYEVMRFCWLEPSKRTKADEVFKLLQQIASKIPEDGISSDAITAFEQKWEHLMPNQRHQSMDSINDQQGSVSSEDSNLLTDSLSDPNSVEELTSTGVYPAPPQAPPKVSRRKLSVREVTIPKADMFGDVPAAPQIRIIDETGREVEAVLQEEETGKPEESKESGSLTEFTEFTSHSTDNEAGGETPNMSQTVPGTLPSDRGIESLPGKTVTGTDDMGELSKVDALSKVGAGIEDESFTFSSPDRVLEMQTKAGKTSTPVAKGEISSSTSSLSVGDSSETFVTAASSSLANLTDSYATASESTFMTNKTKTNFTVSSDFSGDVSEDSSTSFETFAVTAVPSYSQDSSKPEEVSQSTQLSSLFMPAASANKNPFTNDVDSITKTDSFGEFTNGSFFNENNRDPSKPSASPVLLLSTDAPTTQGEFSSLIGESSENIPKGQSIEEAPSGIEMSSSDSKPATQEADPFVSFGTDLSSLSSCNAQMTGEKEDEDQAFPSFTPVFSSFNSFQTDSTATPQAEPQIDIFAFDKNKQPVESENNNALSTGRELPKNSSDLKDFHLDLMSSFADATSSSEGVNRKKDVGDNSVQPTLDLFGNFTSIPLDTISTNNPFSPESGNLSATQQPITDIFGLGDTHSSTFDSSFVVLHTEDSSQTPASSSAFSEFDILSGFSSAPAPSVSPSSPFGGDEGLPGNVSGSAVEGASASAQKESQDDVLVGKGSADREKSSDAALLDFSPFEFTNTGASTQHEGRGQKDTTEAKNPSSLIDF